jgi:hypothetical protein
MTTNLEALPLDDLIEKRDALMRHIIIIDEEIASRKGKSSIFNLLTSSKKSEIPDEKPKTKLKTKIKVKVLMKKKESEDDLNSTTRKIKATVDDMKGALKKNEIKFKQSINRPNLEELVRQHNLVRVSEKINSERKNKK